MFIWGWRTSAARLATIIFVCRKLGQPAAHAVYKQVTKFTLFFIPLFPINSKHVVECALCGESWQVDKEQAAQMVAGAEQQALPHQQQPYQQQDQQYR